jgi:hypothetical protein
MDIGKITKVTEEPRPERLHPGHPLLIPTKVPERVPEYVPARRGTWPPRPGGLIQAKIIDGELVKLPYECPGCRRELIDENGTLSCPVHGLVLDYERVD